VQANQQAQYPFTNICVVKSEQFNRPVTYKGTHGAAETGIVICAQAAGNLHEQNDQHGPDRPGG
jgi:hypothetical protein